MRRLLLGSLLLGLCLKGGDSRANIGGVVKTKALGYAAPSREPEKRGLFRHLCGRAQPACPAPGFEAAPGGTMLIQLRPCVKKITTDARGAEVPCGDCFPNCYLGTPCDCCKHRARYLFPLTPHAKARVRALVEDPTVPRVWIQDPGPMAPFLLKKHFDPAP